LVVAGLAQVGILLFAFMYTLISGYHGVWLRIGIFGISLAPIGLGLRQPWLYFGALAWGTACLVLNGHIPLPNPISGAWGGWNSLTSDLAMMLASTAAAVGQWVNLNELPLSGCRQKLRAITQLTIVVSLLLMLFLYAWDISSRGYGVSIIWASTPWWPLIVLTLLTPLNLILTTVTLILADRNDQ
jgi:hypothetical protein